MEGEWSPGYPLWLQAPGGGPADNGTTVSTGQAMRKYSRARREQGWGSCSPAWEAAHWGNLREDMTEAMGRRLMFGARLGLAKAPGPKP